MAARSAPRPWSSPPAPLTVARRSRTSEMFEGAGVSYWASPVEAKLCAGRGGGAGRRRQLGRTGRGVPRAEGAATASRRSARRIGRDDVALSHRAHQRVAQCRAAHAHGNHRAEGWRGRPDSPARGFATSGPGGACLRDAPSFPVLRRRSQCRMARWLRRPRRERLRGDRRESCGKAAGARCCRSKPAGLACSPSATCVQDRPSASLRPWARGLPSWRKSTACSGAE